MYEPVGPVVIVPLHPTVQATVAPEMPTLVVASVTVPVTLWLPAATYGPTNGPPPPTGGAPAGWTKAVPVSASARAMLMRPLPVWVWVPAGFAPGGQAPAGTP